MGALHDKVTVEKLTDDMIVLGVIDSCWLQELYLLSNLILTSINKSLENHQLKTVRFKQAGSKPKQKKQEVPVPLREITVTLRSHEQKALNAITDPDLQSALHHFLIRCYREKTR
jgi:hypothetical protein